MSHVKYNFNVLNTFCLNKMHFLIRTDCGLPNAGLSERIVGGTEATPFEFPWMVSTMAGLFINIVIKY